MERIDRNPEPLSQPSQSVLKETESSSNLLVSAKALGRDLLGKLTNRSLQGLPSGERAELKAAIKSVVDDVLNSALPNLTPTEKKELRNRIKHHVYSQVNQRISSSAREALPKISHEEIRGMVANYRQDIGAFIKEIQQPTREMYALIEKFEKEGLNGDLGDISKCMEFCIQLKTSIANWPTAIIIDGREMSQDAIKGFEARLNTLRNGEEYSMVSQFRDSLPILTDPSKANLKTLTSLELRNTQTMLNKLERTIPDSGTVQINKQTVSLEDVQRMKRNFLTVVDRFAKFEIDKREQMIRSLDRTPNNAEGLTYKCRVLVFAHEQLEILSQFLRGIPGKEQHVSELSARNGQIHATFVELKQQVGNRYQALLKAKQALTEEIKSAKSENPHLNPANLRHFEAYNRLQEEFENASYAEFLPPELAATYDKNEMRIPAHLLLLRAEIVQARALLGEVKQASNALKANGSLENQHNYDLKAQAFVDFVRNNIPDFQSILFSNNSYTLPEITSLTPNDAPKYNSLYYIFTMGLARSLARWNDSEPDAQKMMNDMNKQVQNIVQKVSSNGFKEEILADIQKFKQELGNYRTFEYDLKHPDQIQKILMLESAIRSGTFELSAPNDPRLGEAVAQHVEQMKGLGNTGLDENQQRQLATFLEANKGKYIQLLRQNNQEMIYLRKEETGLPRTIQIHSDGSIFIHLKRKGVNQLGEGGAKRATLSIDYTNKALAVNLVTTLKSSSGQFKIETKGEMTAFREFGGQESMEETRKVYLFNKGGDIKLGKIVKLYEGHLDGVKFVKMTKQQQLQIVRDMLVAVQTLQKKGYVHADLKLENFLLEKITHRNGKIEYRAHMSDFGTLSRPGNLIGDTTPLFGSPERDRKESLHANEDNWALGCNIYRLIGREHMPWEEDRADETMSAKENPHAFPAPVRGLESLAYRLVHPNPDKRLSVEAGLERVDRMMAELEKPKVERQELRLEPASREKTQTTRARTRKLEPPPTRRRMEAAPNRRIGGIRGPSTQERTTSSAPRKFRPPPIK